MKVYVVLLLQIVFMAGILFPPLFTNYDVLANPYTSKWFLISIFLLAGFGFLILLASLFQLGSNFTVLAKPKKQATLTTIGIYKFIRNPMYLGVLLMSVSWGLFFQSKLVLIFTLALFFLFLYKIDLEEKFLQEKFGKDYSEYKEKTYRLIPFIF